MKTIDKYLKEADTDEHLAQYIRARNRIKIHIKNIERAMKDHEKRFFGNKPRNLALLGQIEEVDRQMKVLTISLK